MSKISKYRISDNLWECECGKQFNKSQSLNAHLSHCDYHHECLGTIRKLRPSELNHSMNWENKDNDEISNTRKKSFANDFTSTPLGKYLSSIKNLL